MHRTPSKIATLTAATIFLLASAAAADDMGGESIAVPPPAQPSAYDAATAESDDEGWRYCTYYILPLTRHLADSGIPLVGRIFMYPLAVAFDIGQLPFGALAGLAGE